MFRSGRFLTWWKKYVDGKNPEDWARADTAVFFRTQGIDPYALKKELLDDFRKYYLMEFNWFVPEAAENKSELAFLNLKRKKSAQLADILEEFPLPK